MTGSSFARFALAALLAVALQSTAASGQATRTWVSGVGDDTNPCSRTAPCKTFAGAISKTAAAGEISVLDSAGFGAVAITKSISIVGEGVEASILALGTNGIVVDAGPDDVVHLQGLSIEGGGTGLNGIRFLAGGALHVRDCTIRGFRAGSGLGISVEAPGPSRIFVSDTTLAASLGGIRVLSTGGSEVAAFLDGVTIEGNAGTGVEADGPGTVVRLGRSTITHNGTGLSALNKAQIISFKTNALHGNLVDGKPTRKTKLK